jgi:hypothetical protein
MEADNQSNTGSLIKVLFGKNHTSDQPNLRHLEMLYANMISQLVGSYDRLKSKFNSFAAKCLTER